jgi:hypothetical protein
MSDEEPGNRSNRSRASSPLSAAVDDEALLSRPLRAALLRELTPTHAARERVHARLAAVLAGAPASPAFKEVDAAMAARAAQLKTATVVTGKSLAAKLVLSGVMLASAAAITTSAILHREPSKRAVPAGVATHASPETADPGALASASGAPTASAPNRLPIANSPVLPPSAAAPVAAEPTGGTVAPAQNSAPSSADSLPAARATSPGHVAPSSSTGRGRVPGRARAPQLPAAPAAPDTLDTRSSSAASDTAVVAPVVRPIQQPLNLAEALALVRGASDALDRKDPQAALGLLSRYERSYPNGPLSTEAQALRAIALCTAQRPEAARARDEFLRTHGRSALAQRVRGACP